MDYISPLNTDTFSNTFSTDQFLNTSPTTNFASPGSRLPSLTYGKPDSPSADQNSHVKSSASPPAISATAPGLNPRSCTTCRKRKVRCDKRHPCSNCYKAGIECVFPRPGRAPRRSKKAPDSELLERLRRLEGVVQSLGKGVDGEDLTPPPSNTSESKESPQDGSYGEVLQDNVDVPVKHSTSTDRGDHPRGHGMCPKRLENDMGRLVLEEGKSRYVSDNIWAGLTQEITEIHDLLDDSSEEGEGDSPASSDPWAPSHRPNHQSFIFGYSSAMQTLRMLHPPSNQVLVFWKIYIENVDPILRVLHKGSAEALVVAASQNMDHLSKSVEALLFSIYFAVITSLDDEQCQDIFSEDKSVCLKRYRFGVEQALAKAGFIQTKELLVLQAFTLFLATVRRYDDTRFILIMTGLATRIGTAMGLHRDGVRFGVPPFETEMRRRLWWQVCTLDHRAAEDQGSDPIIDIQNFDTRVPLNVNDTDIWPNMKEPPKEREGFTEMTFDLLRYEINFTIRRLYWVPRGQRGADKPDERIILQERERLINELREAIEDKYLRYCDMKDPLQWVSANVARLVLAKMWLIIHHPLGRADNGTGLSQDTKDKLFTTSIDVLKYSYTMQTQQRTMKWGWLFKTYIQWHAIAYLLSELCIRTVGPQVDEVWHILDLAFEEWGMSASQHKRGLLWKPIGRLMAKARAARAAALEKVKLFPTDGSLGLSNVSSAFTKPPPLPPVGYAQFAPIPPLLKDPSVSAVPSQKDALDMPIGPAASDEQWLLNDAALFQDPLNEGDMNWEGWDDMVKEFQMEVQQDQPVPLGMGTWW